MGISKHKNKALLGWSSLMPVLFL